MGMTFAMQPWTNLTQRLIRYQIVPGAVSGNWTMTFKICAGVR